MSSIIDRINAPAAQTVEAGQKIKIDDFTVSEVENTISNDGTTRPQMIIFSEGKAFYAPTQVARKVAEAYKVDPAGVRSELIGRTLEVTEFYSNRWRRMLKDGRII